eukprot:12910227-Alexandrium_andersonii.AAC.1
MASWPMAPGRQQLHGWIGHSGSLRATTISVLATLRPSWAADSEWKPSEVDVLAHDVACWRGDALAIALRGPLTQAVETGPLEGVEVNNARRRRLR